MLPFTLPGFRASFQQPMVLLRVLLCCFPAAECWLNWTRTVLRPCPSWKWDGCIACSRQLIALESFFFFCQSRHTWPCPTNDSGTAWNNPSLNECKRHTLPVTHHTYYLLLNDVGWHALCLVGNNNSLSADKSILLALSSRFNHDQLQERLDIWFCKKGKFSYCWKKSVPK